MKTLLLIITTIAIAFTSHAATIQKSYITNNKNVGNTTSNKTVNCATKDSNHPEKCATCPANATVKPYVSKYGAVRANCWCDVSYYASKDNQTCVRASGA